jgi:hypothetical protein
MIREDCEAKRPLGMKVLAQPYRPVQDACPLRRLSLN